MKWASVLGIFVATLVVAGCTGGKFSERTANNAGGSGSGRNVLRYPIPALTKLDPAMVQDGDTIDILQQIFEGLVKWSEDSKVVPNLAESWTVSPDGKTYTFKLRKGVKFSNGREMTADDFKYTFERAADPNLSSETTETYLSAIVGIEDKLKGKAKEVSGVKVVDPQTLTITLDKPRPYFIGNLTYPASFVVCKEALDNGKEISDIKQMVGTGPFVAESFTPEQKFTMKANPTYWAGAPKLEGIERPIVKDAVTRFNMFRNGDVDLTRVERGDLAGIRKDDKLKDDLKFYERPNLYYVGLNCKTYPPFVNRDVRRAFAMAVDPDEICKTTLNGDNAVAHCILPPKVAGHRDNANYIKFNPAEAKRLLASAGYPNGANMPPLVLTHRDDQTDVADVAEKVVTQIRQNLGVKITITKLPWATYLEKNNKKTLDMFHMRWGADYLDPQNFLSTLLASYGPENKTNYKNPQYDALCMQADTLFNDDAKRMALYAQAEDIVLQDAPYIPIYFERNAELVSPRVKGMRESVFGHLPHTTTTLN